MPVLELAPPSAAPAPPAAADGGEVEFRLLGPVEVRDPLTGAGIVPPGSKQRALLSAFVVHAGQLLPGDRLTAELWGDRPPANAANALQAHVARLRRLLPAPGGHPAGSDAVDSGREWISTLPAGYLLHLGPATTDVRRFHRLSSEGRAMLASDPGRAAELLRRALAVWRGPALQDSGHGQICATEADRLEENRLTTLETLYEASLRCARHGEITGELEKLTADHPLRERFYDLLMLALYRSGRQAEALGVYERARRRLRDALGIEPGPALRGRMEAILNHAPALSAPAPSDAPVPVGAAPDPGAELARLRRRVDELGREQEALSRRIDDLTARLPRDLPARL
ncbi:MULTISPECIES: BTAD domain-containing putative transcriptional regulator [unclassified Streptomyces]|uniref:AfsR/SARP family transcriptional regulator n=1 Tax=unclassified Streptomyces TaxID=2593676 RepID=UPI0035DD2F50